MALSLEYSKILLSYSAAPATGEFISDDKGIDMGEVIPWDVPQDN